MTLRWLLASAPLVCLAIWVWATLGDGETAATYFQEWRHADPGLTRTMKTVTDWGNKVFYAGYGALLLWGWRTGRRHFVRLALAYAAAQVLFSFLLVNAGKIAIGKPRPGVDGLFSPFSLEAKHHAWPSGHTAEGTCSSLVPALLARAPWGWLVCALAGAYMAAMGFSRMYLGWHGPSDVLAGWLVGSFAAWSVSWFYSARRCHTGAQDSPPHHIYD